MLLRQVARALGVGKERYYVGRDLEGTSTPRKFQEGERAQQEPFAAIC